MSYFRVCPRCGCNLDPGEICDCRQEPRTEAERPPSEYRRPLPPFERTRAKVYATGNRWSIENFNNTH